MADYKYPKDVPVDEPVAKKAKPAPKGKKSSMDTSTRRSMNDLYPDSVPVDEPVATMAKGGSASSRADGCCTKGKTRGKMV